MKVTFWGTRGSTPSPGADFLRYGGHTSSVALAHDSEPPSLVLDGGTGIRKVSEQLAGKAFRGTILLSHLHWDHVHGLPFFSAGMAPSHRVRVLLPAPGADPLETLARGFSPPQFPITPGQLGPGWSFDRLEEGVIELEGFRILARELPHRGGQTFGFRVSDGTASLAYLTDHSPTDFGPGPGGHGALHDAALELATGVDLLVHDAQFVATEFPDVAYLGHASAEYAVALAEAAQVRSLLLYHHAPTRTDEEIDAIVEGLAGGPVPLDAAREGLAVELSAPQQRGRLSRALD